MVTKTTENLKIMFKENGHLSICGNSIGIRPEKNFLPIIRWIKSYKGENLQIDIDLNFVNCSSVRMLSKAIKAADLNKSIKKKLIYWHYQDSDQEELGEIISSVVRSSMFKLKTKEN